MLRDECTHVGVHAPSIPVPYGTEHRLIRAEIREEGEHPVMRHRNSNAQHGVV